ncbi:MAG: EAL domain-containing protein [Burkholderiales bacterium]
MPRVPPSTAAWSRFRLPLFVLASGVVLSLALGHVARQEISRGAHARFDAMATDAAHKIEQRFSDYADVLVGLRASLGMSDGVTRGQFHRYVAGLDVATTHPGFRAFNFAPFVPAAHKRDFEEGVRRSAGPDALALKNFAITPPGDRDAYYPLTYMEPLEGNEAALGKDMGAIPAVLKALQSARDTGEASSSGKLVRLRGDGPTVGLAIRLPVYRAGWPLGTVEQRRAAYLGSVGAGFHVETMVQDIVGGSAAGGLRLRLFDGGPGTAPSAARTSPAPLAGSTPGADGLVFDSAAAGSAPPAAGDSIERQLPFSAGGRVWVVQVFVQAQDVLAPLDRLFPWLIVLCGAAISLLLSSIVYSLTTARARALVIARGMTSDLRASERLLSEAQHVASVGSWILDPESGAMNWSSEALRIVGFDAPKRPPKLSTVLTRVPKGERAAVARRMAEASRSGLRSEFEQRLRLPDGTERWVHVIAELAQQDERTVWRGTVRDDTQRTRAMLRLKLEHDIARLLASEEDMQRGTACALQTIATQLGWDFGAHWCVGADGRAHCASSWSNGRQAAVGEFVRASRELTHATREGSLRLAWSSGDAVWIDTSTARSRGFARDALAAGSGLKAGVVLPIMLGPHPEALEFFSLAPRVAEPGLPESLRAIALQIGQYEQRKRAEIALRLMASRDALTGLANRTRFEEQLAQALTRCHRQRKRLAVLFVDLDRFKQINDTLGHGAGDTLIRTCAARLGTILRESDVVARFGGDEFVLMIEDLGEPGDAAVVLNKVLAACAEPFFIDGHELRVSASVGVSVYPEDGGDATSLLKNADTAMYRAKERGRGVYQFFTPQMNAEGNERFMLESGLHRALERGELTLHYQPKMNLQTQVITSVEALMRWRHPVLGMISPARFIPIAEETGLIESMGKWALQTACADARQWQQLGLPPVRMCVNLAARQLDSPSLIADVAGALQASGLEPSLLELEITESAMMQNADAAAASLQQLRGIGVFLAIDDFGTGYSSLSYLKRFPLSTVKIDRSFVKDVGLDRDAEALIDGIIRLAHGLRMSVVAEGVETVEQLDYLRAHGCDEIQGYLLCKPAPADEACEFMARHLRKLVLSAAAA